MRHNGFTLIEMVLYIALFSFLSTTAILLYTQTQKFFVYTQSDMYRYVIRRYITVTTESKIDFVDLACLKASSVVSCGNTRLLDQHTFDRIYFIGTVEQVIYNIQGDVLHVSYNLKIGNRVFSEQLKIYLI